MLLLLLFAAWIQMCILDPVKVTVSSRSWAESIWKDGHGMMGVAQFL